MFLRSLSNWWENIFNHPMHQCIDLLDGVSNKMCFLYSIKYMSSEILSVVPYFFSCLLYPTMIKYIKCSGLIFYYQWTCRRRHVWWYLNKPLYPPGYHFNHWDSSLPKIYFHTTPNLWLLIVWLIFFIWSGNYLYYIMAWIGSRNNYICGGI